MTDPSENDLPRSFPAHWIVVLLALAAAAAVQADWGAVIRGVPAPDWRPYSAAALAATTVWLLSTAWLHWRLCDWRPDELRSRLRRLLALAVSELLVACFAGLILWQGHRSRVLLAGLWLVPPALLAVAATSLAVLIAAGGSAWRELGTLAPDSTDAPGSSDRWRTAVVLALFVSLGLLQRQPLPTRGAGVSPARPALPKN